MIGMKLEVSSWNFRQDPPEIDVCIYVVENSISNIKKKQQQ